MLVEDNTRRVDEDFGTDLSEMYKGSFKHFIAPIFIDIGI